MPAGFNPFLLGPGWLDAAYMSYAWPDYFRPARPPQHPAIVKGERGNSRRPRNNPRFVPGQLPAPPVPPPGDFYLPPPAPPGQPSAPFPAFLLPPLAAPKPFGPASAPHPPSPPAPTIHSTSANSEEEDDEDIDVVRSAFVPIRAPPPQPPVQQEAADSTSEMAPSPRCELKAPSSRRSEQQGATTKLGKAVWRPY